MSSKDNHLRSEDDKDMHVMKYFTLILTLVVGTLVVVSLVLCYVCVFWHICCPKKPKKSTTNRENYRRESISLKYLTHISSQPTDTSVV